MKKETFKLIAIHPDNGVIVKKIEFTVEDEEFLDDEEGFDSFSDYVEYYVNDWMEIFEQKGYTVISAEEDEIKYIINELSK